MFLSELSQYSLQSLRIFAYVSSLGSVAEAASALGLTQPAVSLQIHNLEKQLDFHLFERQGRKNILTQRGQKFLQKLLPHLERLERIMMDAKDADSAAKPVLSMGSVEGIGEFWLWSRYHEFSKDHADTRIFLEIANNDALEDLLLTGRLNLVITAKKCEDPRLVSQVLMDERLAPVGSKKEMKILKEAFESAKPGERPWEKVRWLGYGDSMDVDPWTTRWLESVGLNVDRRFKYAHQANSYSVIKEFLREGMGVCVAPLHTVDKELKDGSLVSFESRKFPSLTNRLYISHREGSLSSIHKDFKEWITKAGKQYSEA